MGEDFGILEPADLVNSDGEDTMGAWFGELTAGREAQLFPGPPSGRRRSGDSVSSLLSTQPANNVVANIGHNLNFFGSPSVAVVSGPENPTHPLLVDPTGPVGSHSHPRASQRRTHRGNQTANAYTDLLQTIEDLVSGGALQLFQQLMSVGRGGPGELHIDLPISTHLVPGLDRNPIHRHNRSALFTSRSDRPTRTEPRVETQDFGPQPTLQRWGEEAKITHGKFIADRVGKLANHVIITLLPAAREAAREAKLKAKEQEEQRSKAEAEAAEKEAERNVTTANEQAEPENSVKVPADVQEPTEETVPTVTATLASETHISPETEEDAIMMDANPFPATLGTHSEALEEAAAAMEGVTVADGLPASRSLSEPMVPQQIHTDAAPEPGPSMVATITSPAEQGSSEPGPSNNPRVTVMIHGSVVDITDTGIDPTFLEALPDDMREEVLNQHFRERRTARQDQPPESQISPEFLAALPPELRAEILQQETNERARVRAAAEPPQSGPGPVGPVDIDPASFLASLDPQLRQVVLMDQEDGFLQTLPSHMIAEAGVYREGAHRRFASPRHGGVVPPGPAQPESPRKAPSQRDAIQLLDKNGLATLVRLLFFPQLPRKNLLLKMFVNLCENGKTRSELLNLLLNILQDGTGDLAAVDKSFAQLSFRSRSQLQAQVPPKPTSKVKAGVDVAAGTSNPWHLTGESVPNLVVQRSLEALTFIVSTNETASRFFLTEHEVPSGLKRTSSRKGKGKEKQSPQSHYPIVLLLTLLDRQTLLRTPSMMDSLVGLLATVTRPLVSLKDSSKREDLAKDSSATPASALPSEMVSGIAATSEVTPGVAPTLDVASGTVPASEPSLSMTDPGPHDVQQSVPPADAVIPTETTQLSRELQPASQTTSNAVATEPGVDGVPSTSVGKSTYML